MNDLRIALHHKRGISQILSAFEQILQLEFYYFDFNDFQEKLLGRFEMNEDYKFMKLKTFIKVVSKIRSRKYFIKLFTLIYTLLFTCTYTFNLSKKKKKKSLN